MHGWHSSKPAARRPPMEADAGRVPGAAAQPGDGLDVHGRRGRRRARPRDGRMMVPRGKMLGGSSGINYMAYVRGHPGRLRCLGRRRRDGLELRRRYCRTSRRARVWPRAATSSSTPMPTTPTDRSGSRCVHRCCAARRSSSRPRSRPGSRSVTTTAATAAATPVSCRCCRPRRATASARARTTRSSKARSSSDRTSR